MVAITELVDRLGMITLLDALPDLRMLVTSQAPLRIAVERCVPLGGLEEEAALALVENVARRRGAVLAVQGADRAALLDIVDLLDEAYGGAEANDVTELGPA